MYHLSESSPRGLISEATSSLIRFSPASSLKAETSDFCYYNDSFFKLIGNIIRSKASMFLNFCPLDSVFCLLRCLRQCQAHAIPLHVTSCSTQSARPWCGLMGEKHILIYEDMTREGTSLDKCHSYCQNHLRRRDGCRRLDHLPFGPPVPCMNVPSLHPQLPWTAWLAGFVLVGSQEKELPLCIRLWFLSLVLATAGKETGLPITNSTIQPRGCHCCCCLTPR